VNGARLARNLSATVVAGIAAWSSYSHMVHVALRYGERAEVAVTLPLSADGMLVVASVAMLDDRRCGRRVRPAARVAFIAGVAASMAANIAAAQPDTGARAVAAWPAVALLLVVEMLSRTGRPAARGTTATPAQPAAPPDATADDGPRTPSRTPRSQPAGPRATTGTGPARAAVPAGRFGPAGTPGHAAARASRPTAVTRQLALQVLAAEPDLTKTEVAVRVGVSPRRLRAVLRESP
jgi:hypothetical protein